MDLEAGNDDSPPLPGGGFKLVRQIIGKLKDWAALTIIALYLLALPASWALKDPTLAFGMAFAFSVVIAVLRAFQMSLESRNLTARIDADRDLKLQKARNDLEVKLARLNKPGGAAPSPVPGVGGRSSPTLTNSTSKRAVAPPKPKPLGSR
ncbi:hypothetical protein [Methylobacterium sp. XJLW]|uniref:hypothetical protein n=1 Tax=Methylobacterium sp. XJLW TaxID=739141 RepID=UPI000F55039D|nr:hypothetical protein [Methylobacterium sp. XJLW]